MVCDGYREDFRHILTRYAGLFRGSPGDESLTVPRSLTAVYIGTVTSSIAVITELPWPGIVCRPNTNRNRSSTLITSHVQFTDKNTRIACRLYNVTE